MVQEVNDAHVARLPIDRNVVGVAKLTVSSPSLAKLEQEPARCIEHLNAVVVGVGHDDVVGCWINSNTVRIQELTVGRSSRAELEHLLAAAAVEHSNAVQVETSHDNAVVAVVGAWR